MAEAIRGIAAETARPPDNGRPKQPSRVRGKTHLLVSFGPFEFVAEPFHGE